MFPPPADKRDDRAADQSDDEVRWVFVFLPATRLVHKDACVDRSKRLGIIETPGADTGNLANAWTST
ncbi:MAG: hypothetical protein ACFB11_11830 [Paracoccaceae bacterium]